MRVRLTATSIAISLSISMFGTQPSFASGTPVDPGIPTLYWNFDSAANFNHEGVYGTALDKRGSASFTASGYRGGGLSLESSTASYLASDSGLSNLPIGDSRYTLSAWVKSRECDRGGILWWGPYGGWAEVTALRVDNCGFVDYWFRSDNSVSVSGAFRDTWHFVSSVYDGTSKKMYVDGSLLGTVSSGSPHGVTNEHFRIGNTFPAAANEYFTGILDEVSIFARALSVDEISYLMTNGITSNSGSSDAPATVDPEIERQKRIDECRVKLIATLRAAAPVIAAQLNCADLVYVNDQSLIGINEEISKMDNRNLENLAEISKVMQKHVTIDRIATKQRVYFRDLSYVGLASDASSVKTMIMRTLRSKSHDEVDSQDEILRIVSAVEKAHLDRKAALLAQIARIQALLGR